MFRTAIALTGEPQLVAIADANGDNGHAMVVYRVTPNRLYVADPNYPESLRTIRYDATTGKLGPYNSGANAGSIAAGDGVVYTRFAYIPAWASASDAAISRHWAEVKDKTIGNDIFPAYGLEAWKGVDKDGKDIWVPLIDGYKTPDPTLRIRLVPPAEGDKATMAVFRDAEEKPSTGWGLEQKIDLEEGPNQIGVYELGAAGGKWAVRRFRSPDRHQGPDRHQRSLGGDRSPSTR